MVVFSLDRKDIICENCCLMLGAVCVFLCGVSALWPLPLKQERGGVTNLAILPHKSLLEPIGLTGKPNQVLQNAMDSFPGNVFPSRLPPHNRIKADDPHAYSKIIEKIQFKIEHPEETALTIDTDESYSIQIDENASVIISANTSFGFLRALSTFSQLLNFGFVEPDGNALYTIDRVPIFIEDSPRFPFRGLMIDTSRHYLPMELILDNLDIMAFNKLNVLHWHVVDSQSFPYRSESEPDLTKGAFEDELTYSANQVREVVHQAFLRGIRVIPEFDTPGHSRSWKGIDKIMSHCRKANEPLNPTREQTYAVYKKLMSEVSHVFSDDFVHIGGDEVGFKCWKNDHSIKVWMAEHNITDYNDLEHIYIRRVLRILKSLGKKTVVWQEVFNQGLLSDDTDAIVDVWKGYDNATIQHAFSQGKNVIVSGPWYLDHLGDSWDVLYKAELEDFVLNPEHKGFLLGGHCSMWGERVDPTVFMPRVWPRASAIAEKLWSTRHAASVDVTNRMDKFRCDMVARGYDASPIQPGFCPVEPEYHSFHHVEQEQLV